MRIISYQPPSVAFMCILCHSECQHAFDIRLHFAVCIQYAFHLNTIPVPFESHLAVYRHFRIQYTFTHLRIEATLGSSHALHSDGIHLAGCIRNGLHSKCNPFDTIQHAFTSVLCIQYHSPHPAFNVTHIQAHSLSISSRLAFPHRPHAKICMNVCECS